MNDFIRIEECVKLPTQEENNRKIQLLPRSCNYNMLGCMPSVDDIGFYIDTENGYNWGSAGVGEPGSSVKRLALSE